MSIERFWAREEVRVLLLESRGETERAEEVPVNVVDVIEDGTRVMVEPLEGGARPKAVNPISLSVLVGKEGGVPARMSWLLACERLGGLSHAEGKELFARIEDRDRDVGVEDSADLGR